MLEIIATCILLFAGEEIKPETPWVVEAIQTASKDPQGNMFFLSGYGYVERPIGLVRVRIKRPIVEGETVTLPKSCHSEVEVRKP